MTDALDVEAIVLAAGRGERLGLGPKAWLTLGGRTLLERAVQVMAAVARRVIVGAAPGETDRALEVCGRDAVIVPGASTRQGTLLAAFGCARAPFILLHDVAHPFVTPSLARRVLEAARASGAAIAAVTSESVALCRPRDGAPHRLGAGEVHLVRRPVAFRRADFALGLEGAPPGETIGAILARAGVRMELVPAPSWSIKLTTPDDWLVAEAIERGFRPV
jgi:2-C-methyl-D-erythritol 4-phosphate cytidylyltransferase